MARTALAATAIKFVKGPNPGAISAGDLTVVPVVADVANGNSFVPAPNDVLHAWNSGASPFTVTLTSSPDERKRSGDITTYSLAVNDIITFNYGDLIGWIQSDGNIYINGSNVGIKFWVERRA